MKHSRMKCSQNEYIVRDFWKQLIKSVWSNNKLNPKVHPEFWTSICSVKLSDIHWKYAGYLFSRFSCSSDMNTGPSWSHSLYSVDYNQRLYLITSTVISFSLSPSYTSSLHLHTSYATTANTHRFTHYLVLIIFNNKHHILTSKTRDFFERNTYYYVFLMI